MRNLFNVTYDLVTPESSETGDFADNGFLDSSGDKNSVSNPAIWGDAAGELKAQCAMTLREAIALCGGPFEDCGYWFAESDAEQDYSTGEHTSRAIHPPENISAASYNRLCKLLRIKS